MSNSVITVNDECLKRLISLSNRAESLFKKVRRYKKIGYDTAQLFEDLTKTREEIQKILRDYCGLEPCDEEMESEVKALQERMKSENK